MDVQQVWEYSKVLFVFVIANWEWVSSGFALIFMIKSGQLTWQQAAHKAVYLAEEATTRSLKDNGKDLTSAEKKERAMEIVKADPGSTTVKAMNSVPGLQSLFLSIVSKYIDKMVDKEKDKSNGNN